MIVADERDQAFVASQPFGEGIPAAPYPIPALKLEDREGYPFVGDWMAIVVSRSQATLEEPQ